MNQETLEQLHTLHFITQEQKERIARLSTNEVFSLHDELRSVLLVGVALLVSGIVVYGYQTITTSGQQVLIALLFVLSGASFLSSNRRGLTTLFPKSELVTSLRILAGCVFLALAIAYWQYADAPFGSSWELICFISGLTFLMLALWHDHRGALAFSVASFGVSIGLMVSPLSGISRGFIAHSDLISVGFAYGGLLAVIGSSLFYFNIRRHFTIMLMNCAAHFMLLSALAGLVVDDNTLVFFLIMSVLCYAALAYARHSRSFSILLTSCTYGYLGMAYLVSKGIADPTLQTTYMIVSCLAVVMGLLTIRKSFVET